MVVPVEARRERFDLLITAPSAVEAHQEGLAWAIREPVLSEISVSEVEPDGRFDRRDTWRVRVEATIRPLADGWRLLPAFEGGRLDLSGLAPQLERLARQEVAANVRTPFVEDILDAVRSWIERGVR